MNRSKKAIISAFVLGMFCANINQSCAANADDRYFYIGTESGFSVPVVDKFTEGESSFLLGKSSLYGGVVGYSFYPGMEIEFSYSHQPSYKFSYHLEHSLTGDTRIRTNTYMINYIYSLPAQEKYRGIKPYCIGGIGISELHIRETHTHLFNPLTSQIIPVFAITENKMNRLAYQVGLGAEKDLTENFSINFAAKLQIINNISLRYKKFDFSTGQLETGEPVKKSIGVGEFTIGLLYKFPI